ncbi:type II toxin-antitoxin system YafQ family toxin [Enterococcus sp. AN402]|uniref:type II toxin-antitoxin system YafQ family toxin n=1 Tax=Enterococcus sp. AN402 TaxID=3151386 RepID=UPI00345A4C0E
MKIKRTPTFKRNYKFLKKKHYDMQKLEIVLELLVQQQTDILYQRYKDHALKGNKQGLRELHIEKDWLLVYEIKNEILELWLLATGKHDDVL